MAPIVASIEISRSPEDVFAYVTDPSHLPEWQGGVVRAERVGEGPVAVGRGQSRPPQRHDLRRLPRSDPCRVGVDSTARAPLNQLSGEPWFACCAATEPGCPEAGSPAEGRAGLWTVCSAATHGVTVKESVSPASELSPA
jgi:hypothetical protein